MIRRILSSVAWIALAGLASSAVAEEVTPAAPGVTASTNDGNLPGNTVDNSLATRWSASGDGQWIQFDLGATRLVESISIAAYQGNARRNQFDLQVSTDGGTWTAALTGAQTGGTSTGEQSFDLVPDRDARYVRYVGHGATLNAGGTSAWNSLTEVSIFAAPIGGPTPTPTPVGATPTPAPTATPTSPSATPTPTPTAAPSTNLALGKPATASSVEGTGFEASKAVDGSTTTRWASAEGVDPQWIRVDLGSTSTIGRVVLRWEAAYGRSYQIQTSGDGATWATIFSTTTGDGGVDDLAVSGSGRYVRMNGTARGTAWGYSLFEFEVYGTGGPVTPTPTPTATPVGPTPTPTPTATPVGPTPTPTPTLPPGGTRPVDINGQLSVCGTKLCNQHGNPIQLRGMSTHGLQWYGQCYDPGSAWIDALVNDWKADILRVSMYVQEGGYETDPAEFTALADRIIDKAIARGIYVVIDWHMLTPGDPNYNLARARTYFTHMAQRYGHTPNVLYEIANEPSGVSWTTIRNYANQIIPTIRNIDPNGVILVGTRAWSSLGMSEGGNASEVINNPVPHPNLMYVFHMYAASHGTSYLNALSNAANSIPMFVTEWGTQTASGDGGNNFTMSQQYVDMMRTKQISWINWNYSDDSRSGAVFTGGTCPGGPFTGAGGRLKPAGTWIRDRIISPADNFPTN